MFMSCCVYLYYLYRTYVVYYYYTIMYSIYNNYKTYQIIIVTPDKQNCYALNLDKDNYTLLNSKIFTSFIIVKHQIYKNQMYSTYYEIIRENLNTYDDFMNIEKNKKIKISNYKFIGAEVKNNENTFIIPIKEFLIVSNQLFFKEFNMWLLQYYFKSKYENPNIKLIDENINIIELENESLTILENDYVKTI